MSLLDVLRSGIKTADSVTKPLQPTVMFQRYVRTNAFGEIVLSEPPVPLRAIVEWKQRLVNTPGGVLVGSRVTVLFLDAAALAAATDNNGLTTNDKIVLPKGETGPIVGLEGFLDAITGEPVTTTAFLE